MTGPPGHGISRPMASPSQWVQPQPGSHDQGYWTKRFACASWNRATARNRTLPRMTLRRVPAGALKTDRGRPIPVKYFVPEALVEGLRGRRAKKEWDVSVSVREVSLRRLARRSLETGIAEEDVGQDNVKNDEGGCEPRRPALGSARWSIALPR